MINSDVFTGDLSRTIGENVGNYQINQGTLSNSNYDITYESANLEIITGAIITITADSKNKIYGEIDPNLTYQISTGNLEIGDVLSGDLGEDVGIYAINQGSLTNSNYAINFITANLEISQKSIEITADVKTKIYVEIDTNLTYQISTGSLEVGDVLYGNLSRDLGENIGGYTINKGSLENTNYNITFISANFSITKKPITVTVIAQTKEYGENDSVLIYNVNPSLIGSDVLNESLTRVSGEDVGNYQINQGTLNNDNYTITYVTAAFTITKKTIIITADSKTKIYGEVNPILTYTIDVSIISGDILNGGLSRDLGENVGIYAINSSLENSNYEITFVSANLEIIPKPIILTADAQTKVYGETDSILTYSISPGLILGDILTGNLSRDIL